MADKLKELAFGYTAAIISAALMLVVGILANLGLYTGAAEQMQKMHMFFSLSIGGIIAGMVEAAIMSFIVAYAFAAVYNRLK